MLWQPLRNMQFEGLKAGLTVRGTHSYPPAMPEVTNRNRRNAQTLGKAHDIGQLLLVECGFCRIKRHYLPGDLFKLLGDVPFWDVEHRMRCVKCGRNDLRAHLHFPSAEERQRIRVRRLREVRMVRRVIWQDE